MVQLNNPKKEDWERILKRPEIDLTALENLVSSVFERVQINGDKALFDYTKLYDGIDLDSLVVSEDEISNSTNLLSEELKTAIKMAKSNIQKFHFAQKTSRIEVETTTGVLCWQEKKPIQKVGLYIPGGSAPLFSTVLMLAIPAKMANCNEIVLCSPPDKTGAIHPAILFAAHLCGITKVFKLGGIQAIAAMTFGTKSIPGVYKIFGPGNQYVTAAKQLATKYKIAIDMPAGPSELMIFADDSANSSFVAADLLSQAEHGQDSQVLLVSTSKKIIDAVLVQVHMQMQDLPRKEIAAKALENSKMIFVNSNDYAIDLINNYAPEHLIICSANEDYFLNNIQNAGSVFVGNYTPESAGDYASGTNHTLPTNGFAKNYSGVNLDSFLKTITYQKISEVGLKNIGKTIEIMAENEGLIGHKKAVSIRIDNLSISK